MRRLAALIEATAVNERAAQPLLGSVGRGLNRDSLMFAQQDQSTIGFYSRFKGGAAYHYPNGTNIPLG